MYLNTARFYRTLLYIAAALALAMLLVPLGGSPAGAAETVQVRIWTAYEDPTWVTIEGELVQQVVWDLDFVDENKGWVATSDVDDLVSGIFHTSDGGQTWEPQWETADTAADSSMRGTYFLNATTGWAFGGALENQAVILHTTNGGVTWTPQTLPDRVGDDWDGIILREASFVDADTGWVVGLGGVILKTTDGGTTWEEQDPGTNNYLLDVHFFDANNGVVVGSSETILTTDDGGATWTSHPSPVGEWNFSITCLDEDTWWIGAGHGNVLYTEDGGTSFEVQQTPSAQRMYTIDAYDADNVIAGTNGPEILRTTDGGTNWEFEDIPDGGDSIRGIQFLDADTIYAAGWMGFWKHMVINAEVPTADFSASATAVTPGQEITFTNETTGYTSETHPMTYEWDFGDEETSTLEDPTHSYSEAGKYTVTLTATNLAGEDDVTKADFIFVTAGDKQAVTPGTPTTVIGGSSDQVEIIYVVGAVTKRVEVEISEIDRIPALPAGYSAGTSLFAIDMWDEDEDPVTTLAEPVVLTVGYSGGDVAAATRGDTDLLVLAYYDEEYEQWVRLDTTVDTTDETLSAETTRLGVVAVLAKPAGGGGCGASAAAATTSEIAFAFGLVGMLGVTGCFLSKRKKSR